MPEERRPLYEAASPSQLGACSIGGLAGVAVMSPSWQGPQDAIVLYAVPSRSAA